MPNTREKLIELLADAYGVDPAYYGDDVVAIADHLIANGVTIQNSTPEMEVICERIIDSLRKGWLYQARFTWCGKDWFVERKLPESLIAESAAEQKWIPVTERLPEVETPVLTYRETGQNVELLWQRGCQKRWEYDEFTPCPVTHWMPLPEPPKGE